MKVLVVNREPGEALPEIPMVDMLADSSIVLPGRPLFLPAVSDAYTLAVAPAFRISRLGKNIGCRFSNRYFDSMTIVALLIPDYNGPMKHSAVLTAFDSSLVEGQWIPVPADSSTEFRVEVNGERETDYSLESSDIYATIANLSRYFTLKNGDIIIPSVFPQRHRAVIDTRFTATLNGYNLLDFKIK